MKNAQAVSGETWTQPSMLWMVHGAGEKNCSYWGDFLLVADMAPAPTIGHLMDKGKTSFASSTPTMILLHVYKKVVFLGDNRLNALIREIAGSLQSHQYTKETIRTSTMHTNQPDGCSFNFITHLSLEIRKLGLKSWLGHGFKHVMDYLVCTTYSWNR
jgi:hypothetical protein